MRQGEDARTRAFEFAPAAYDLVDASALRQRAAEPCKMVILRIAADRENRLDAWKMRKQWIVPRRTAFPPRRQVGFELIVAGKAQAHRHDRDLRLVVKHGAIDAQPLPQPVARGIVERQTGL